MSDLFLYNLSIKRPSHSLLSVIGSFTGSKKQQDIVIANGTNIQLLRPNSETGTLSSICQQDVWAEIVQVKTLRPPGHTSDLLVVTSDSGKLAILKFNPETNQFYPVVQEPYTKTGFRRISPAAHLAIDPSNRVIMMAALEKNKICYNVASADPLKLGPPKESSVNGVVTISMISLDTEYENPIFVALEVDGTDSSSVHVNANTNTNINFYEFDQALNHIVKHKISEIYHDAYLLIPVHKRHYLVCTTNGELFYEISTTDSLRYTMKIPKRHNIKDSNPFIKCYCIYKSKKTQVIVFIQTTDGDIFKITAADENMEETGKRAQISYFDTIPLCNSMHVLKSGFLYANLTNSDHALYQFESLGEENDSSASFNEDQTYFIPNQEPQNLTLVGTLSCLSPILSCNLNVDSHERKQLLTIGSNLKFVNQGLKTNILVSSPLPLTPISIFTSKLNSESFNDEYLVISSTSQTLVLSIGEVVEEVTDSHFEVRQPTIAVQQIGKNSIIQVYEHGIRHVKRSNTVVETNWYPPAGITILCASCNNKQVVLALSNREVCYFEVSEDDQLLEYQDRTELNASITSIAISPNNSKICVVGTSDETIQVLSLDINNCLATVTIQALSSKANSLLLQKIDNYELYLHIGMQNGLHVRTTVDEKTGKLTDTRTRFLGTKPVQLSAIDTGVLAISSSPWICDSRNFTSQLKNSNFKISPLNNVLLTSGTSFYSEDIGGAGIVGVTGNELVIFTVEDENDINIEAIDIEGNPKKLIKHEDKAFVASHVKTASSQKSSKITIIDIASKSSIKSLMQPEIITSMTVVEFESSKRQYLIVGTHTTNKLYTYELSTFNLVYETALDMTPLAMCEFKGKLLVTMNNHIRLYEMGKKQLLRKSASEISIFKKITHVSTFNGNSNIIIASDVSQSVSFFQYDKTSNQFFPFADDIMKRYVTSILPLDEYSVAGGDKFGNFFVLRLSEAEIKNSESLRIPGSYLNGSATRLQKICEFHLADIPTSLLKGSLNADGVESIIYSGLQGSLGILIPLSSKNEIEFYLKLEAALRDYFDYNFDDFNSNNKGYNLLGRDHLKFRGYYNPCKNVIDGDLIERYVDVKYPVKVKIASMFDRTPKEIEKKIEDLRNRSAF